MLKSSEEYWIERVQRANAALLKETEELMNMRLISAYKRAYEEVISGEILKILQEYSDNNGEISLTKMLKYDRLKKMTERFTEMSKELGDLEQDFFDKKLPQIYEKTSKNIADPLNIDWSIIPKEQINRAVNYPWSGSNYSDLIWENKRKLVRNLAQTVTQGIIQGKSITTMMGDLQGVMGKGAYECRRIVRTETMHMVNAGAIDTYKAGGVTEVKYIMSQDYYSNGKPRYCEICAADKDIIFDIEKAPILPRHPNCRCTYAPVISTIKKAEPVKKAEPIKEVIEEVEETKDILSMDFKELKEYAGKLGITFGDTKYGKMEDLDLDVLRSNIKWIDGFNEKYPNLLKKYPLTITGEKDSNSTMGSYYGMEINLNSRRWGKGVVDPDLWDAKWIRQQGGNRNWKSRTTSMIDSTMAHEFGHYVSQVMTYEKFGGGKHYPSGEWDKYVKSIRSEAFKEYEKQYGEKLKVKNIERMVSEYGASSAHETFAEAFQEAFNCTLTNEDRGSKLIAIFKKIFERELSKL